MSPANAKDIISSKRESIKSDFSDYSFDKIKEYLINEKGFSQRNADWAIDIYVSDMEEILLSDLISGLFADDELHIDEISTAIYKEGRLCAHDCLKIWFDQNVRRKLAAGLKKHEASQEVTEHVLYEICDYSKQQFEDDEWEQIDLDLPVWIKPNEESLAGWERGIKEAYRDFENQFIEPLKKYLIEQLPEDATEDILENSFYHDVEEQYADIFDIRLEVLRTVLINLKKDKSNEDIDSVKVEAKDLIASGFPTLPIRKINELITEIFGS